MAATIVRRPINQRRYKTLAWRLCGMAATDKREIELELRSDLHLYRVTLEEATLRMALALIEARTPPQAAKEEPAAASPSETTAPVPPRLSGPQASAGNGQGASQATDSDQDVIDGEFELAPGYSIGRSHDE